MFVAFPGRLPTKVGLFNLHDLMIVINNEFNLRLGIKSAEIIHWTLESD